MLCHLKTEEATDLQCSKHVILHRRVNNSNLQDCILYTLLPHIQMSQTSYMNIFICFITIIVIGIQPLGQSGQRPELSQATGMDLVCCILGKFLGIACHCFPPVFRCSHFSPSAASTSATT